MTPTEQTNEPVNAAIENIPAAIIEDTTLVIEPVVPVVPALPELRYEFQPTDADGRPMGGKQVIIYRNPEELAYKLSEQSTQLLRKLRDVTRKNSLGIFDEENTPETRYTGPTELKPRVLGNDERAQLAQDLLDPENFDRAISTVFEASVGTTAKGLSEKLSQLEQDNTKIKALRESDAFMSANPAYVKCEENGKALAQWVARRGYAPTAENFQKAYDTLLSQDVLVTSLEVIPQKEYTLPEPPAAVVVTPEADELPARESIPDYVPEPVAPVVPKTVVSRVPSSLNRGNSSDAGTPVPLGDEITYEFIQRDGEGRQVGATRAFKGKAALDAMPPDEYKRRLLHEKGFAAKVDKLYAKKA